MTARYYHASEKTLQATAAALPEIGKANTLPESTGASAAKFDSFLASLTDYTDKQLEQLTKRARVIMDGRKRTIDR